MSLLKELAKTDFKQGRNTCLNILETSQTWAELSDTIFKAQSTDEAKNTAVIISLYKFFKFTKSLTHPLINSMASSSAMGLLLKNTFQYIAKNPENEMYPEILMLTLDVVNAFSKQHEKVFSVSEHWSTDAKAMIPSEIMNMWDMESSLNKYPNEYLYLGQRRELIASFQASFFKMENVCIDLFVESAHKAVKNLNLINLNELNKLSEVNNQEFLKFSAEKTDFCFFTAARLFEISENLSFLLKIINTSAFGEEKFRMILSTMGFDKDDIKSRFDFDEIKETVVSKANMFFKVFKGYELT